MNQEPTRLVRLKEVVRMCGIGRSSVYLLMASGDFPRGTTLGRRRLWPIVEIQNWITSVVSRKSDTTLKK